MSIVFFSACIGCGSASHIGVLANIPTVGVAKKLFYFRGMEEESALMKRIGNLYRKGDTTALFNDTGSQKLSNVSSTVYFSSSATGSTCSAVPFLCTVDGTLIKGQEVKTYFPGVYQEVTFVSNLNCDFN